MIIELKENNIIIMLLPIENNNDINVENNI